MLQSWRAIVAVTIAFSIAGTAYAAVIWVGAPTGLVYLNPGYQFTVGVTSMTQGDDRVCLRYTVNGGPTTTVYCTCTEPNCGTGAGTWVCTIPTNYDNSTINWNIGGYNNNCNGQPTSGLTGSFPTGPTAVTLTSLDAPTQPASWLLPLGLALLVGAFLLLIRRRAH